MREVRRRYLLVIQSLAGGGSEKILSQMANWWALAGSDVMLVTMAETERDFWKLEQGVKRESMVLAPKEGFGENIFLRLMARVNFLIRLRGTIKSFKPDVVISFAPLANLLSAVAMAGTGIPLIISERCYPPSVPLKPSWELARRYIYKLASAIVVQSAEAAKWARTIMSSGKVNVIPNHYTPADAMVRDVPKPAYFGNGINIVAAGRIDWTKGFDLLVDAFAKTAVACENAKLIVFGDGEDRAKLEEQIRRNGVADKVYVAGQTPNLIAMFRHADLFVMSSRTEGFPNVMLEAMDAGIPVISFDCPAGPREIIEHGRNGILVPAGDSGALATMIDRVAKDRNGAGSMAMAARADLAKYDIVTIMSRWESLATGLIGKKTA